MQHTRPISQLRWIEFRNVSGETVPAFAVLRVTGSLTHRQHTVLNVAKPNLFGSQGLHPVNGPQPIPAGQFGLCTFTFPAPVLYESADGTPSPGEGWGPRAGLWKLRKATGGFQIAGTPDTSSAIVLAVSMPMRSFVGKTDAAHNKGATGTVSIYTGPLGTESDTGENMSSVYNRFANIESGKWVRCEWNGDHQQWELTAAEC